MKSIQYEKSWGTVTFKEMNHKRYYLLIHHNKGHWGFPKGHIENSETEEETAIRETKEETNVDSVIIPGFREVITYSPKENVMKDVVFFLANPKTDSLIPQEIEVSDVRLVEESEVMNLITYKDEIDKIANENMNDWTIDRLGYTDQAILRMGIFELLYTQTPDIVAINEAVELAKQYSDEKVKNMINGVMDNILHNK